MKSHVLMVASPDGVAALVGVYNQQRQSHLDREKSDLKSCLNHHTNGTYLWVQVLEIDVDLEAQKTTYAVIMEKMKPLPNVVEINVVAKQGAQIKITPGQLKALQGKIQNVDWNFNPAQF